MFTKPFNLIYYITQNKGIKQKDIAKALNVTPGQVSKWRSGEYMSDDKEKELMAMAGLFGDNPEWAAAIGSEKKAREWYSYIQHIAQCHYPNIEYRYIDDPELYVPSVLLPLHQLGINISTVPDIGGEVGPLDKAVYNIMRRCGVIEAWFDLWLEHDQRLHDESSNLRCSMESIAMISLRSDDLVKLGADRSDVLLYQEGVAYETRKWIEVYIAKRKELGLPLVTNYFELLTMVNDEVEIAAWNLSMEPHITYAERTIIEALRAQEQAIKELTVRLDNLIASKSL